LKFEITILGSSSALPTSERNTTAQIINHAERFFLIDCGEGTQIRMRQNSVRILRIDHIFISHLHGDHLFGLPGLLNTMNLLGRQKDLNIYAPPELNSFLQAINTYIFTKLGYAINIYPLKDNNKDLLYENKFLKIYSFPVSHRIPTWGFSFEEKKQPRKLIKEAIEQYNIPIVWRPRIKNGEDYITSDRQIIPNEQITKDSPSPRKYVFITDTEYLPSVKKYFDTPINTLYHEATFLDTHKERAQETKHSTASQAGKIATILQAQKLLLGHFSTRYKHIQPFINEAKKEFNKEVHAVRDGDIFSV